MEYTQLDIVSSYLPDGFYLRQRLKYGRIDENFKNCILNVRATLGRIKQFLTISNMTIKTNYNQNHLQCYQNRARTIRLNVIMINIK